MQRKTFKVINEEFSCQNCGQEVAKMPSSCRNHCNYCLYSLHLDALNPGDRASNCHGLMKPIAIEKDKKNQWDLIHECKKCGKIIKNKIATDDNMNLIIELSTIPYEPTRGKKN